MFIPVWVVVALFLWVGMSSKERDQLVITLICLVLLTVAVIVGAVVLYVCYGYAENFIQFISNWWLLSVPGYVKGCLFLIGLVVYCVAAFRGIKQYYQLKSESDIYSIK